MFNSKDYFKYKCNKDNIKLKDFLKDEGISSRFYREVTRESVILVNGEITRKNKTLNKNDEVLIKIPEENLNAEAQEGNINILYEDDDILVVNKEPFMVTHTSKDNMDHTLLNFTCYYFQKNNIKRKVRFANRLDRDTSGIVIICKNSHAHSQISEQFEKDTVVKKYIAVTKNNFKEKKGIIEYPIKRSDDGIRRIVAEDGKYCKTGYEIMEENEKYAIVKLRLYTGRTHQIRVHLSYMNCPIVGDTLYGSESEDINRQALHCYYIEFNQPRTGERLKIEAPLFEDMRSLIEKKSIYN